MRFYGGNGGRGGGDALLRLRQGGGKAKGPLDVSLALLEALLQLPTYIASCGGGWWLASLPAWPGPAADSRVACRWIVLRYLVRSLGRPIRRYGYVRLRQPAVGFVLEINLLGGIRPEPMPKLSSYGFSLITS